MFESLLAFVNSFSCDCACNAICLWTTCVLITSFGCVLLGCAVCVSGASDLLCACVFGSNNVNVVSNVVRYDWEKVYLIAKQKSA